MLEEEQLWKERQYESLAERKIVQLTAEDLILDVSKSCLSVSVSLSQGILREFDKDWIEPIFAAGSFSSLLY